MNTLVLADVETAYVEGARERMEAAGRGSSLTDDVWARYAAVLSGVTGSSLLDVGYGAGGFLDAAYMCRAIFGLERIAGVEPRLRKHMGLPWDRFEAGAEQLPFADGEWDTVSAQEMLEHLPDETMERALPELRRVAARRLIVTVPYRQERLSGGHVQRFDEDRLLRLFPGGQLTVMLKTRPGYPWALVVEDRMAK